MNVLTVADLVHRLEQIESLLRQNTAKAFYTVDEFAAKVDRAPYTVRQWCNDSQINATKSQTRTGPRTRWAISHAEYERFQREGLLPKRLHSTHAGIVKVHRIAS